MRGKVSVFLLAGFVASLCALTTIAQAGEQKPQLYFVTQFVVKPSMVSEFETGTKEWLARDVKLKYPYPWYTRSCEDFHYIFITPVKNFADLDKMEKTDIEFMKKMGEDQFKALMKLFEGTCECYHATMARSLPEISYIPENPRLKHEESNFICTDFFYIQPGKEKEFEKVCKEWVTLQKNKNIPDGYSLAVSVMGTELPLYIGNSKGKNAGDYFSQMEKNWKLLGDEGKALMKKTMALCRKIESKNSWFRPDLSYIPKEK